VFLRDRKDKEKVIICSNKKMNIDEFLMNEIEVSIKSGAIAANKFFYAIFTKSI